MLSAGLQSLYVMNVSGRNVWLWRTYLKTTLHRCAVLMVLRALVPHLTRLTINQKAKLISLILEDIVYALATMYRIRKDNRIMNLVCLAFTHTERVPDFKRSIACDGDGNGTAARTR
jgi:hypothetical protein